MKKIIIALALVASSTFAMAQALAQQEFKVITTIESVVPGGLGRSRMITTDANGEAVETPMKNFFSMVGINFGNVKENDNQISKKLNEMSAEGWALYNTTSGVYSADKSTGIFITRYFFSRPKN